MNYLLANDTSSENNPGCKITVSVLHSMMNEAGHVCINSVPVGFGKKLFTKVFRENRRKPKSIFKKIFRNIKNDNSNIELPAWDYSPKAVDHNIWKKQKDTLRLSISPMFKGVDLLLVNGEGTIHHNMPSALALLGIISLAIDEGIQVALVNATVQAMDEKLLNNILGDCTLLMARESKTYTYLKTSGLNSILVPDLAWFSTSSTTNWKTLEGPSNCLLLPGVLGASGQKSGWSPLEFSQCLKHLFSIFETISYMPLEGDNPEFLFFLKHYGVEIIERSMDVNNTCLLFNNITFLISGRYHMLIFGWGHGIPCIPLTSNTWKIEGLLETLSSSTAPLTRPSQLTNLLKSSFWMPEQKIISNIISRRKEIVQHLRLYNER